MLSATPHLRIHCNHVSLRSGSAVVSPEHPIEKIRLQRALRPIHPAVGQRALRRIVAPELTAAVTGREIAKDCMRFPDDRSVIVDDGDAAVWVHRAKFRRIETAVSTAQFHVFIHEAELADEPHHLLDIEGALGAIDGQHQTHVIPWRAGISLRAVLTRSVCNPSSPKNRRIRSKLRSPRRKNLILDRSAFRGRAFHRADPACCAASHASDR